MSQVVKMLDSGTIKVVTNNIAFGLIDSGKAVLYEVDKKKLKRKRKKKKKKSKKKTSRTKQPTIGSLEYQTSDMMAGSSKSYKTK